MSEEPVTLLSEVASLPQGARVRVHVLLEEWNVGSDAAEGILADETGRCPVVWPFRGRRKRHQEASELLNGFVLALRATVQADAGGGTSLELTDPSDLISVQVHLRPEHYLGPYLGKEVTVSGDIGWIGWLPARGECLLLLSEAGRGVWASIPYLEDEGLLKFAREVDFQGFAALHGQVERLELDPGEAVHPRVAWLQNLLEADELLVVRLKRGEDVVHVDPGVKPPLYSTDCGLGQSLGCLMGCCALEVRLSAEELTRGFQTVEIPGGIHYLRRDEDGFCHALDRETGRCGVYEIRPQICRDFSCIHRPHILDRMTKNGVLDESRLFVQIDP